MKRFFRSLIFLFSVITVHISSAQTGVNSTRETSENRNKTPGITPGIAFTPEGMLQTAESGGAKNVKTGAAPDVHKSNSVMAALVENPATLIEKLVGLQFKYAMLLDVEVESLKNLTLFGFIDNWFGTRYLMGGNTKSGVDCSALTSSLLLAVYGFVVPRTAKLQFRTTRHIRRKNLQQGDLVFFNTHGGVSHVGLYLENHFFVHASASQGVTISSLDDHYYSKRFICGGRVEQDSPVKNISCNHKRE
jgi:hypothetical protein